MGFLYFYRTLTHAVDPIGGAGVPLLANFSLSVVLTLPAPSISNNQGVLNPRKAFLAVLKIVLNPD